MLDSYENARLDLSNLAKYLQSNPSLVSLVDDQKRTLLHWAVDGDNLPAVNELLLMEASIDPLDADGLSPLGYAASSDLKQIGERLLYAGADPTRANVDMESGRPVAASKLTRNAEMKTFWFEKEDEWRRRHDVT